MKSFDIAIIGGGPGGYVAAIKAGQMGKSVICIDNSPMLGGTCLNVGCIPSKALLHITHQYSEISFLANHGIYCENVSFSLEKMMQTKQTRLTELHNGIQGLFKKNNVTYVNGTGQLLDQNTIQVGNENFTAQNIILATGSSPISLPNIMIDEEKIVSSTGALSLSTVPKHMVVIGAGVIGLELGSVWARLGSKVTIIEFGSSVLNGSDSDISNEVQKILIKQGLNFIMNAKVTSVQNDSVTYQINHDEHVINDVNVVLVAVGRQPNTSGFESIVKLNDRGQIEVNEQYQTSVPNIYAIGDVIAGPMLAHKASEEGIAVIEKLCGKRVHVNYNTIPNIVYTSPEIAIIGKTENQLKASDTKYRVGKFSFAANSRAKAIGDTTGFVKVLVDSQDEILGAAIINSAAGELIHEIAVAMEFRAASEDVARVSHGHPTMSEAIKEAMLAAHDKPIHS